MRIAAVEFLGVNVTPKTNWCFLLVRTASGRTGIGECTLANQEALLEAEAARLAANVIGEDALAPQPHRAADPACAGRTGGAQRAVGLRAGAVGPGRRRTRGRPIHALLGGALRDAVPLYANINRGANPRTPEGFAAAATRAVAEGFRAVKLAPFEPLVWEDARRRIAARRLCARASRASPRCARRSGASIDVMVDAHWRFSPGGAARLVQDVAPFAPVLAGMPGERGEPRRHPPPAVDGE